MLYVLFFILGGLYNLQKTYKHFAKLELSAKDSLPHKKDGYVMAFVIGAIFFGGVASVILWLVT
jgi:hypothetical protein